MKILFLENCLGIFPALGSLIVWYPFEWTFQQSHPSVHQNHFLVGMCSRHCVSCIALYARGVVSMRLGPRRKRRLKRRKWWWSEAALVGPSFAVLFNPSMILFSLTIGVRKEYYDIPWARLRSVVEPSFAERSVINHREYLNDVKLVVSEVVNVTETEVTTAGGEKFEYDYLVIAVGHIDPASATKDERLYSYRAEYERLKSAKSVLILGGGPTGVELAGEISVMFLDKKVILVHRGMRLLEFSIDAAELECELCCGVAAVARF